MVKPTRLIIKAMVTIVALFCVTAIIWGCASLPRTLSFPIVNSTGANIVQIYIRDTGTMSWGQRVRMQPAKYTYTQSGSYQVSEYVRDYSGNIDYNLANGNIYHYSFVAPRVSDGQTPQYKSIDIKFVDANGYVYGKNNVNLTNITQVVINPSDMYPMLTMQNNTGFPISINSPITKSISDGSSARYIPESRDYEKHTVSYSIGDYVFNNEVYLNWHINLALTERPPVVTVHNNTGYPITINSPFWQIVDNGASSYRYPKKSINTNSQNISYNSGTFTYNKAVTVNNEDVVLTLTEADRPPIITIENNTGNTVNLVFLRNHTTSDWGHNIIGIPLDSTGIANIAVGTASDVRRGSFTNKENFKVWLGSFPANSSFKYDIRIDDVNGNPYVKSNEGITKDMTLTFTHKDKP